MSRDHLAARLHRIFEALTPATRRKERRQKMHRFPGVESLEGRALLANITASAVISSAPDGADFDYTITLTNSTSSTSGVGTFWYAWNLPNVNYLATSPVSVSPPAGWSDQVTNTGPSDGFGILYTANSSASYLAPGSSLVFKFTSADSPSSVNGNSPFYPGVPVNTSFVYPEGAFSDAGHEFVVQPVGSPTPTPTPTPTPSPTPTPTPSPTPTPTPTTTPTPTPPVMITGVRVLQNKKHMVTEILIDFSGSVNASEAESLGTYQLTTAGSKGSFTARNARHVALSSAAYTDAAHEVALKPRKAFALTKAVELKVIGQPPGGLQDSSGRFIDGNNDGIGGDDGEFVITRRGVTGA